MDQKPKRSYNNIEESLRNILLLFTYAFYLRQLPSQQLKLQIVFYIIYVEILLGIVEVWYLLSYFEN